MCLWISIPSSWPILLATERGKQRKLPYVYLRVCDFQKVCSHSHTTIMQSLNPESFIILLKRWSTNGAPYILGLRCFLVFSDAKFVSDLNPMSRAAHTKRVDLFSICQRSYSCFIYHFSTDIKMCIGKYKGYLMPEIYGAPSELSGLKIKEHSSPPFHPQRGNTEKI